MTRTDIEAALALAEKATKGPWSWTAYGLLYPDGGKPIKDAIWRHDWYIKEHAKIPYYEAEGLDSNDLPGVPDQVNADVLFTAHARTTVPAFARQLLAAMRVIDALDVYHTADDTCAWMETVRKAEREYRAEYER